VTPGTTSTTPPPRRPWFATLAPGVLVAATGVGAGDLLTASFGGSALGVGLIWAAIAGAVLKWCLNEGIARWQMANDATLLEGWVDRLGGWIQWVFLAYLLIWSAAVGAALAAACGVAGASILPITDDPAVSKLIYGVLHALAGVLLVRWGGYRLFQKAMGVCVGLMFVTVMTTAVLIRPDLSTLARGLVPILPADNEALGWTLGVLGGVGGTLTLLSYGYWIREEGRSGLTGLRACRIDLAVGYALTALFGVAMIVIGARVDLSQGAARSAGVLADQLGAVLGPLGKAVFLAGFWGAVFSSLLGVWQSVPYLFADFLTLRRGIDRQARAAVDLDATPAYRWYLLAIAILPLPLVWRPVAQIQLAYAVLGALFMPLLALTLLIMNNRRAWVGSAFRNGPLTNLVLLATLALFSYLGIGRLLD